MVALDCLNCLNFEFCCNALLHVGSMCIRLYDQVLQTFITIENGNLLQRQKIIDLKNEG